MIVCEMKDCPIYDAYGRNMEHEEFLGIKELLEKTKGELFDNTTSDKSVEQRIVDYFRVCNNVSRNANAIDNKCNRCKHLIKEDGFAEILAIRAKQNLLEG